MADVVAELNRILSDLEQQKEEYISNGDFASAGHLSFGEIPRIKRKIEDLKKR